MVQVVQHVSPQTQYQYFRNFGVGSPACPACPRRATASYPASKWWGDERYTLSFGQGVAVTAVQMASVYSTIANGGVRVDPLGRGGYHRRQRPVRAAPRPATHRVIQAKTAYELMGTCSRCPGSTPRWASPGRRYRVLDRGQDRDRADRRPEEGRLPVPVRVEPHRDRAGREPEAGRGGERAEPAQGRLFRDPGGGPVFYKVMSFALQTMKIPPTGQASQRQAHGTVIRGNLGPCLRLSFHAMSRRVRSPNWPCCSD